ncbi:tripartite tricarboxylate transporter permease [Acuticoccus sp. MNP-M23]|uniref:tripartite tricarboxylate transporter permease n=1 Tax=Acuticoccus sp. MNP-M23 TaxID=3072793 RepID=UPI002815622F|nr:tripartite tricarboxylate transporter permease [Acuticoccus sp. MNP-M23]WMS43537.1 tripartite tricarboxylate transporter permease [Acuticoccus sp. MNP-M23]
MLDAFLALAAPWPVFYLIIGTALGIVVGSIPGLTASMLIALTLPLTFSMSPTNAMTLLIGEYVGGISGGLIAATLMRMPGTPASIMTTFDGFPMAQRGAGERALSLGVMASFIGGLISWGFLALLSPPLARLALTFGPWEYFTLVLMALVMLASLSQGSMLKGLIAACLGVLLAMPGIDPSIGQLRLTFGFNDMTGGLSLLPVLIGTFAVSQIIKDVLTIEKKLPRVTVSRRGVALRWSDIRMHGGNLARSGVIGTWIGLLPGIGGNIAAMMSYATARQVSRTPERFGTGHEPGVVAAETANNASIGGALIPLITMGIPGSVTEAILIGALIIHNLQPGPLLFITNPEVAYGVIASYLAANVVMVVMMLASISYIARLMYLPRAYLLTAILLFCVVGTFALNNRFFDVWVMLAFGAIGYLLERVKVPLGPFVIGFVLSPIAEEQLRSAAMSSGGDFTAIFTRPFATTFLIISLATLVWPFVAARRQASRATQDPQ